MFYRSSFNLPGVETYRSAEKIQVSYCGEPLVLLMPKEHDNELEIGKVLLTKVGEELAAVCRVAGVDGFLDYVKEKWKAHLGETNEA